MRSLITHTVALVAGLLIAITGIKFVLTLTPATEFHEHADIAVFLNGQRFDLSQQKYMSTVPCGPAADRHAEDTDSLRDKVHLHDGNGRVIHVHYPGVTYGEFFESLGMMFSDGRLVDDMGIVNENTTDHIFRYFINGEEVYTIARTPIRDLDQVLITYGPLQRSLDSELAAVSNESCIASGACLHRGVPEQESCNGEDTRPWIKRMFGIQ